MSYIDLGTQISFSQAWVVVSRLPTLEGGRKFTVYLDEEEAKRVAARADKVSGTAIVSFLAVPLEDFVPNPRRSVDAILKDELGYLISEAQNGVSRPREPETDHFADTVGYMVAGQKGIAAAKDKFERLPAKLQELLLDQKFDIFAAVKFYNEQSHDGQGGYLICGDPALQTADLDARFVPYPGLIAQRAKDMDTLAARKLERDVSGNFENWCGVVPPTGYEFVPRPYPEGRKGVGSYLRFQDGDWYEASPFEPFHKNQVYVRPIGATYPKPNVTGEKL